MESIFAKGNGREITGKDKIFGINQLAKKAVEKYGKKGWSRIFADCILQRMMKGTRSREALFRRARWGRNYLGTKFAIKHKKRQNRRNRACFGVAALAERAIRAYNW